MTARPMNSVLSARPGPDVTVSGVLPAYAAPSANPIAAISSSAWWTTPPTLWNEALR